MTGITVTLYERTEIGRDGFNAPIYDETPLEIENVLSGPAGTSDTGIPGEDRRRDVYGRRCPGGMDRGERPRSLESPSEGEAL